MKLKRQFRYLAPRGTFCFGYWEYRFQFCFLFFCFAVAHKSALERSQSPRPVLEESTGRPKAIGRPGCAAPRASPSRGNRSLNSNKLQVII
jgi:hypothetical protein